MNARAVLLVAMLAVTPRASFAQGAEDDDLDVPATPTPPTAPTPSQPPVQGPAPAPSPGPGPTSPTPSPTPTPSRSPSTSTTPSPTPPSAEPRATNKSEPTGVASHAERHGPLASAFDASGLQLRGFVQAQGQIDQQSQDQLMQGGQQLNLDGFVVRRARVSVSRTWEHAGFAFELDANTINGAAIGLRRAEASLRWPGERDDRPLATISAGLGDIPFGREFAESSQHRLFMERTTASLALFPGEADIGARAFGAWREFRYAVAVLAGEPINERNGFNRSDPNAAKDYLGRVGVDVTAGPLAISGGVSIVLGTGFHAGRDATKDALEWRDLNENGGVELGELFSVPGAAAIPSENFRRWGLGSDISVGYRSALGWTRITAEITVASNLDRGLFVADPIVAGADIRHLGAYGAVTQDIGKHAFAGVRFDFYDPNLDAFDSRTGMLIPRNETIATLSPLIGANLPPRVRAVLQYELVLDNLARDERGVPADLANNRVTARLQVDL